MHSRIGLAAALALAAWSHAAVALTCQAQQGAVVVKGAQADESDIQITLPRGRFIWVALIGEPSLTVDLMRPATKAEMADAAAQGDKDPPTSASAAHVDATEAQLAAGVRLGTFVVTCKR
jgi:hypothetical protein